jgi:hypothetical protein
MKQRRIHEGHEDREIEGEDELLRVMKKGSFLVL